MAKITRTGVSAFRAMLATKPGRRIAQRLSNQRIVGTVGQLKQVINEAANSVGLLSGNKELKTLQRYATRLPRTLAAKRDASILSF